MPTEFFEKGGKVSREYLAQIDHELIYSTYLYSGSKLILDGFLDFLKQGRLELKELERGIPQDLESISTSHYPGSIASRLYESPHGLARLVVSYHVIPDSDPHFVQIITIGDTTPATRYVHLLIHNLTLLINDQDRYDEFVEDDTPEHIELGLIERMIGAYKRDMEDYLRRSKARLN